jgi:16S rRNA (cytosine1402-N4)-methyltransferase
MTKQEPYTHRPVLLDECIEALNIRPDGIYVDGTLGRAGHSREIAKRLTSGRLICVDRDSAALEAAQTRLADWMERVTLVHSNFDRIDQILADLGIPGVDGMLFDLGVSSPQLDDGSRGFSYMADAPLDMRMDQSEGLTAADVVNLWPQEELRRILFQYGEERCAPQIAAAIVRARSDKPIQTTLELVDIIKSAMPAKALREKQHPAKRSFQAIRIAVNDELSSVDRMLKGAIPRLNQNGRLAVITFHSLEDRIVKNGLAQFAKGCTCPPDFPVCVCGKTPDVKLVNKKPIIPTEQEIKANPRARSAKLRVCVKLKDPSGEHLP